MRRIRWSAPAFLALVAACWPASPAPAAFPGQNGQIAFVSDRDGNLEIYVMNADGSGQTRLTTSAGADSEPAFSPDGKKIAFRSDRDGDGEIFVMNADGTGQTPLTSNAALDSNPTWSPASGSPSRASATATRRSTR